MKFLHLSDLHIGRRLGDASFLEDQEWILKRILQVIDDVQPQAVLIAGDVYDKSTPSGEAITLFDDFLFWLTERNVPVLIISGNHDSPERLSFGNRLLKFTGVHISPVYDGHITPVTLTDDRGPVHFWLLPFVKPTNVRRYYPDADIESYTDALRVAIENMHIDTSARNVLVAHQFVTGATVCESEDISVGGLDNVDAAVFDDFDYVALGHIHGRQNIGSNRLHYCGTPLKYSFSEARHEKTVTLVHLNEKGQLQLEAIPLQPRLDLREIRGSFSQLTDKSFYEHTDTQDYLHIILTDEQDIPEAMGRLRVIYPNLLHLSYDNTRTRQNQVVGNSGSANTKSPLELFEELYQKINNQPMSDAQRAFALDLINSIKEDKA